MVQLTFVYLCLPTLLLAAPLEDGLKQQIAAGLLRNDESQWNFLSPGANGRHLNRLQGLGGRDGFGYQKKFDSLSGMTFGNSKRNFDEIDNAGFGAFVKKNYDALDMYPKRNFDEIDNAGFGAFLKRST